MSDTRSGRATDRVVGAAADENDEAVASWAELADDVAGHVDDFLTALDAVASGGAGAQAVALLLLEVSQVHFVGAQLGGAALRALQAGEAHARLDTTPEPHPDEADESSS